MILVTGAGGFIGRRLVSRFASNELEVMPLYRSEHVRMCSDRWEADLTRSEHISLLKEARDKPTTVIHLGGYINIVLQPNPDDPTARPIPGMSDISRIYKENVLATANLLDFCLDTNVEHIIFASSQAVYGMPITEIITEESPCRPLEHYANSKLCCEQLLQVGARQGTSVTVLRFPGVFSEERRNGVVYEYCKAALHKKKITVSADIPLPLDVIYIDDVVNGFYKAVLHGGDGWLCLNLATGEHCSLNVLADAVAQLVPQCQVEYSKIPQPIICMNPSRAHATLGWRAVPQRERLRLVLSKMDNYHVSDDHNGRR